MSSEISDQFDSADDVIGTPAPADATPPDIDLVEKEPAGRFLNWPPPGLESIQRTGLSTAGFIGCGALTLVVPLLVSIGINQRFTSYGPFDGNWIPLVFFSMVGLILLADGLHRLFHILRTGNLAVREGHGWLTVAHTVCDTRRDMGFLLQGARGFAGLESGSRQTIVQARLIGMGGYLAAALWLLPGFVLGVYLAARGVIGNRMVWIMPMGPSLLFFFTAIVFRIRSSLLLRGSVDTGEGEIDRELRGQITDWIGEAEVRNLTGFLGRGPVHRILSIRIASTSLLILSLIILIPLVSFVFVGSYIPFVVSQSVPRFQGIMDKAYIAEVVRDYRPAFDPEISATAAGEALQCLNYRGPGTAASDGLQRPPVRRYGQGWQFGRTRGRGPDGNELLLTPTADLTPADWEVMRSEAGNPAHREFAILGRAGAADFATTLWVTPFPDTLSWTEFPIPRFQGISDGAKSHVAVAAFDLHSGRRAEAERKLRDLIGTGFLMMDEHPTIIGNLIGIVVVGIGADGLGAFYEATGRTEEAETIRSLREEARQLFRSSWFRSNRRTEAMATMTDMARIAEDQWYLRGMRWEFLGLVATTVPFVNLNKAVFGPGDDYEEWLISVKSTLVRYPGEEALYTVVKNGWIAPAGTDVKPGFIGRLLGLTFGRSESATSIALMLRRM